MKEIHIKKMSEENKQKLKEYQKNYREANESKKKKYMTKSITNCSFC